MRLFLQRFLIALKQALTDPQAGISIGMIAHLALWAEAERGARGVALFWLALVVANDRSVAAMTLSARIARIHATCDDTGCIPGFVFRVVEDTPFHPVGAFPIASARILPLLRTQVAQVFKHENTRLLFSRELDNASAHQVRDVFINVPDLAPEVGIVLFALCKNASLRSVACNASKQARALCPLPLCHSR